MKRRLKQLKQQERIREFRGKLKWTGDLERMRTDRRITRRAPVKTPPDP